MPVGTYVDANHPSPEYFMTFEFCGAGQCGISSNAVGIHVPASGNNDTTGFFVGHRGVNCDGKTIGIAHQKALDGSNQYGTGDWSNANNGNILMTGRVTADGWNWDSTVYNKFKISIVGRSVTASVWSPDGKSRGSVNWTMNADEMGDTTNRYIASYAQRYNQACDAVIRNLKIYGWK
jgi:hypothetical protein